MTHRHKYRFVGRQDSTGMRSFSAPYYQFRCFGCGSTLKYFTNTFWKGA